ncbi:MAG: hypothetical protein EAZ39_09490 [Oscillatoriales cyanobacterium]|uniref:hypothetical protein n=1 Tax=Microcoleus sp. PH2017_05_CCC_O_A TaxID=2798816 RepID=UPI001D73829C|nr:hypothetical protein [Microcoleus sp. PH2017_05_CCC_O_A]MCC3439082.1 hypothetical protein [Microcoleus sp. PH2017_05_CCC_O_A]TAG19358.1 MAG: hypothetical protein EAZ39_09490 [Oscillatoriales cyanobacterium]
MTSHTLNLPVQLQQEAEKLATLQGISLDQFILWAVAEKVATLNQRNDDRTFPQITIGCFQKHKLLTGKGKSAGLINGELNFILYIEAKRSIAVTVINSDLRNRVFCDNTVLKTTD